VSLNPEQFLLYSTAGFVVGMLVVGLLIAQSWSWQTFFEGGFSCGCLIGWIGGRFFPTLEIEDLPLVGGVTLRPAKEGDLSVFFRHQRDTEAARMASTTAKDRKAYLAHWRRQVFGDPSCEIRTVIVVGVVAGYVGTFEREGRRMIGYWLGREFWDRGVATAAVAQFLADVDQRRPIHAEVARSNLPSRRVLEKCGFHVVDQPDSAGAPEMLFELPVP